MRMNQDSELSAHHVINEYEEDALRAVFYQYGELRQAPAIARTIVESRQHKIIETVNN